ncbi:MAG TPA: FAD-dependent oxidoreductase [Pseudomonadales bacterium]|nr:FAD-dependent oxidoreductase [Pseudomonadales bacterium]
MSEVSRRTFLEMVGAAAGSGMMYRMATAMGVLVSPASSALASLNPIGGAKRSVVVLGAGIGGLTAAHELRKAGYDVTILEASHRAGGRNMTLRHGDIVDEVGNRQTVDFDDDPQLYFNCGPARIPAEHTGLMGYCRELGVALEVFVNDNRNAYAQWDEAFGGKPVRQRQYVADARGFMMELMAKTVLDAEMATPFRGVDVQKILALLTQYGDLSEDHFYRGSARSGYKSGGFVVEGEHHEAFDFKDIMDSNFWRVMSFSEATDQAPVMMQPVGGMDRVVAGFMRKVGDAVQLNAWVKQIELQEDGVQVTYGKDGSEHSIRADYCVNCIPTHLVAGLKTNFPSDYMTALRAPQRGKLFKIGLQASERFWEKDLIFGGISWTGQPITQIWYPNHDYFAQKGILQGAYTFGDRGGEYFAKMSPAERIEAAISQGEKVHPDYRKYIETGVSVPWHRMNHMLGCSARWSDEDMKVHYPRLQAAAGRHYMVGDQISHHSGWQEGAIRSAHHALADIDRRVSAELRGDAVNA